MQSLQLDGKLYLHAITEVKQQQEVLVLGWVTPDKFTFSYGIAIPCQPVLGSVLGSQPELFFGSKFESLDFSNLLLRLVLMYVPMHVCALSPRKC